MAKIESKPRGVDRGAGTTTGRDLRDLPRQDLAQTNFTGIIRQTRPDLERIQQTQPLPITILGIAGSLKTSA